MQMMIRFQCSYNQETGQAGFFLRFFFKKDFSYLFLDREEGREKERGRNTNVQLPLTCPPLGIEPVTLWFVGRHSIH